MWTRDIGMLESSGVWDAAAFDSADYALLTAFCHPDAALEELLLVTDWYVWLFFLDDHFLESCMRRGDTEGGRAYLARLAAFIPEAPGATTPAPDGPAERALADLWLRTAPGTPGDWRRRFRGSNQGVFDEHARELTLYGRKQVPDPVTYLDMRRQGRGGPWAAELVELTLRTTLPATVSTTQTMRALKDAFGDVVRLHDDLTSYRREVEQEGEVNNEVLVVEHFLGCDPQEATGIVRDLLASRSRRSEEIVGTELPILLAEQGLGPPYSGTSRGCGTS
ncbi:terpene synthase family protein [Streptomyces roseifaciens]|uniref:terpene synthase family protein n=1 Tax=Streptomyces roseifaciens TaxID=1488406 RepID=UPI000717E1BB|nr:hypothetical protein [Streptomyces roseifaciens]